MIKQFRMGVLLLLTANALAGCQTDETASTTKSGPKDCSAAISVDAILVKSHDEMVERFGNPTRETRQQDGGLWSDYPKFEIGKVPGCLPTEKASPKYAKLHFEFHPDGTFSKSGAEMETFNPSKR